MKVEAGQVLADLRSSIEGRVGASINESDVDRPCLRDLRGQRADIAENGLQMVYVEPVQCGSALRIEANHDFCGRAVGWAHTDAILTIEKAEDATMHGDFGNVAPGIGKARYWPFRAGGIGPGFKDPIAEIIEDENQRAKPDREAPEQAPKGAQDP